MLEPGTDRSSSELWALGTFRSQRRGFLLDPKTWALPPLSHRRGGWTHLLNAAAASHSYPGERRQGQAESNTSPIQIWPTTEELGTSTDLASGPAPHQLLCHLSSMKCG